MDLGPRKRQPKKSELPRRSTRTSPLQRPDVQDQSHEDAKRLPQDTRQAEFSKLGFPYGDTTEIALKWRLQLIKQTAVFPVNELTEAIVSASKGTLPDALRRKLVTTAKSDIMTLDEIEKTQAMVTKMLLNSESDSPLTLLKRDRHSRLVVGSSTLEEYGQKHPDYIRTIRKNQLGLGQSYLRHLIPPIRAKLAFQEIVSRISPDEMVPFMVSLTAKYLGSPFTQQWITIHQHRSHFGTAPQKTTSRKLLLNLSKAIQGDFRSNRKRRHPYWSLNKNYEDLAGRITGFRKQHLMKSLDPEFFSLFCDLLKIPEIYPALILESRRSPKSLALEIMSAQGKISDPKSFKDFQPVVNKLRKKHFGAEISVVIEDFLDLPTQAPGVLSQSSYLSVLELVRLTPPARSSPTQPLI